MDQLPSDPPSRPFGAGCRFTVEAASDDDVVVTVIGDLDPSSAGVLVDLVESAIGTAGTGGGIEIDLRRLRACSNSGIRALTACARLGARLREGLHFRVGLALEGAEYESDGSVTIHT